MEFFRNQSDPRPELATFTDDYGNFFLSNPPHGPFRAKVSLGGRSDWINVSIDANGIQPPTLVVNW